jgi:hypothetical protein
MSANCQGELLDILLRKHQGFTKEWEIKYYVNFQKTPIPAGEIENCDLLLYQRLGEYWGELSSEVLLKRLPKTAKAFCLPNMLYYHLWPTAVGGALPYDLWRDSYVEDLISRKLTLSEITHLTMRADFSKLFDLPKRMEESLQREYEKNYSWRDEIFEFIEQNWRNKQIFTTPNHPANELIFLVLNLILKELGFSPEEFVNTGDFVCDSEFFLPVHPFYIKHYGVKHLTEETLYPVFGKDLTYKEYLMAYVDARQHEIPLAQYFLDLKK